MTMEVLHIPTLPAADFALSTLERLRREFGPIAERRCFRVLSLSEMCCCGDGFEQVNWGYRAVQSEVTQGYNECSGDVHRIHVRLRRPHSHGSFLPWDDAVRTMAHELAHCVHRDHSDAFYRLMEEILDQHAAYLVNGTVSDPGGFPAGSAESHTLGGGTDARRTTELSKLALERERRQAAKTYQSPRRVGGDGSGGGDRRRHKGGSLRRKRAAIREKAALAAEARMRQHMDETIWHPSREEQGIEGNDKFRKSRNKHNLGTKTTSDETSAKTPCGTRGREAKRAERITIRASVGENNGAVAGDLMNQEEKRGLEEVSGGGDWSCSQCAAQNDSANQACASCGGCALCTYLNPPSSWRCQMCGATLDAIRAAEEDLSAAVALANGQEAHGGGDEFASEPHSASLEVEWSIAQFGFNIYESGSKSCK